VTGKYKVDWTHSARLTCSGGLEILNLNRFCENAETTLVVAGVERNGQALGGIGSAMQ
jgi:hypothetical protein